MINVGFASLEKPDGVFVEKLRGMFDCLRIQLYHYVVITCGGVQTMKGKNVIETGCGRGGGINYLAEVLEPEQAVGLDFSQTQVCQSYYIYRVVNICMFRWTTVARTG